MDLTSVQIGQLAFALLMAVLIFVVAWAAPLKTAVTILFVLVPFQLIDTKYGSSNVVMTFILFAGLLMSGRRLRVPMLGAQLAVLFVHLLSMTQVHKSVYGQHLIYIMLLISGLLVFILVYNLAREVKDVRSLLNALIVMDILVCIYCAGQMAAGLSGERTIFFGIDELSMSANRASDSRLVGPFAGSAGITAEYLALMVLILCYDLISATGRRKVLIVGVIIANLAFMTATANRGSFLTLVGIFPFFLLTFRRQMGTLRVIQFSVAGAGLLIATAVVIVTFTDFNRMFDRLEETTATENGVPATRAKTWPVAWENIKLKPWLGHGPRLRLVDDFQVVYKGHVAIDYPHSLYLMLLFTMGIVGLIVVMFFIFRIGWYLYAARHRVYESEYVHGLVRLGPLLITAFVIDQARIEFLRIEFVDYWHFVFGMFGMWLGVADRGDPQPVGQLAAAGSTTRPVTSPALVTAQRELRR